jgi:O-antigen/teichoic acid export membrane protein
MKKNSNILALIAQGLNVGFGLILIPVITSNFNQYYAGLWFVFFTIASLNQILELGFMPNIARNLGYILSGSSELVKEGVPAKNITNKVDFELLNKLILASKYIYKYISVLSIVLMYTLGSLYIYSLYDERYSLSLTYDLVCYCIFILSSVLNLYYNQINAIILGYGEVDKNNIILIINKSTNIVLSVLLIKYGLLGIAIANFLSMVFSRIYGGVVYKKLTKNIKVNDLKINNIELQKVIKTLSYNSFKVGLSQISSFMILKFNIFICASVLGVAQSTSFSMMISIVSTLKSFSSVFSSVDLQNIVSMHINSSMNDIRRRIKGRIITSIITYVLLIVIFDILGKYLLFLISPNTTLPDSFSLYLCYLVFLLELNHVLHAAYITTFNEIPFVKSGIISGLAIVVLSSILAPIYGILGLVVSQFLVQLSYNNWKWPIYLASKFNRSIFSFYLR